MTGTSAIILAAGEGTRMKSKKPKVAHELLGKPLIRWVVDAAHKAGISEVVCVLGHAREQVTPLVEEDTGIVFQEELKGTADAVATCKGHFEGFDGSLLVLSGDCPLITPATLEQLIETRERTGAQAVVLTMEMAEPFGYGRIVRGRKGGFKRIVEQKDCSPEQETITECNSGFYCFDAQALFSALDQVKSNNRQNEFYLTDVLEICRKAGGGVVALQAESPAECLGVNSRAQLAQATKQAQKRINACHMQAGVTMTDPDLVWIGSDVEIGSDTEILPLSFLMGKTVVGSDCVIGPNTRLTDTVVGNSCTIDETVAIESRIDDFATCGPRAYLRPLTHLCEHAKAGTHVEIKKSTIGAGSKVPHLSYIGDTTMGAGVNIGAGSITCNYDGKNKFPTVIGDNVFVGSDTMMVAPVKIGDHATIGAGSVITKEVSARALALGRARQTEIPEWEEHKR
ncbi:MAG: bifunctional UDP-N-acetylglucosamine diphosphorylase/glucosamine-1-phosphate N-acetyltransferase GlmU, partial [Eggerthellaceae bacterium]|nr:bifunctional UDP-N-acetylglucosamine diphosphorylase/glucosamine-1-phosphate N-acetyltransferase GlmU [Eggerthellaceae bacterium]